MAEETVVKPDLRIEFVNLISDAYFYHNLVRIMMNTLNDEFPWTRWISHRSYKFECVGLVETSGAAIWLISFFEVKFGNRYPWNITLLGRWTLKLQRQGCALTHCLCIVSLKAKYWRRKINSWSPRCRFHRTKPPKKWQNPAVAPAALVFPAAAPFQLTATIPVFIALKRAALVRNPLVAILATITISSARL